MRVTIERLNLLKALNHIQRVVERRNTIPILANVLLQVGDAELTLKATDLDLESTETVAAIAEQTGATTVPAHMFYDIVRKLPDGSEVMLASEPDGAAMTISSGRSRFHLQVLPDTDFPDITAGEFDHSFHISCAALKGMIDHTQFAISTEETRYYLNGIYFHAIAAGNETVVRAVATDGHRLARAEIAAPAGAEEIGGIIVPRKAVGEIHKLVEDPEGTAKVEISDTKIRVSIGSVVLTSKLIDGTFPDYERVIPADNDKRLVMDCKSFASAVDRVSTISSERGRAVKMAVGDGQLVLSVNNPDSGSATEELAVEYDAEPIEIGFNSRYLLDITNQLTGDETEFMLSNAGSPALIRSSVDADAVFVLMPMRV